MSFLGGPDPTEPLSGLQARMTLEGGEVVVARPASSLSSTMGSLQVHAAKHASYLQDRTSMLYLSVHSN